jgi:hypothetical protein
MRRVTAVIFILFSGCFVLEQGKDWTFVQSVGGLSLGVPVYRNSEWSLPVKADVSGATEITIKPTAINSGLACKKIRAHVRGNRIYLSLVAGLAGSGTTARCPASELGKLPQGRYEVFYENPDQTSLVIGKIDIAG